MMRPIQLFILLAVLACLVCHIGVVAGEESRLRQLTNDPAQDGFPCWSPDGKSIVFSRYGMDIAPERTGLYLLSPDTGELKRLTTVIGEHPDWSPDGKYIAFDGDLGNCIQVVSAAGGSPIRIDPDTIEIWRGGQPAWSPDGSHIAFMQRPNLWVLDVATGQVDKVLTEPGKIPIPTCWSHDGSEIYLYLRNQDDPGASICAVSATGDGKRELTSEKDAAYRYSDLSPDGTLLAFVFCEGRDCNIWVMPSTGGKRVQITSDPSYDDGPSWSPDGKRIAFVSTRSGNFDVWMLEVDVEKLRRELAMPGGKP